jgi:hypothetical protein
VSSATVRACFRAAWPSITPALPYVDTISKAEDSLPDPLPDVWGTLAFATESRGPMEVCARPTQLEIGVARVFVMAKSGLGDAAAVAAATSAMHAWEQFFDLAANVEVARASAPIPIDDEANGEWFILAVDLRYRATERP